MKFVKGLNDSFDCMRSEGLLLEPLRDIKLAFNMAITHERQQACATVIPQVMLAQGQVNQEMSNFIMQSNNFQKENVMPYTNVVNYKKVSQNR